MPVSSFRGSSASTPNLLSRKAQILQQQLRPLALWAGCRPTLRRRLMSRRLMSRGRSGSADHSTEWCWMHETMQLHDSASAHSREGVQQETGRTAAMPRMRWGCWCTASLPSCQHACHSLPWHHPLSCRCASAGWLSAPCLQDAWGAAGCAASSTETAGDLPALRTVPCKSTCIHAHSIPSTSTKLASRRAPGSLHTLAVSRRSPAAFPQPYRASGVCQGRRTPLKLGERRARCPGRVFGRRDATMHAWLAAQGQHIAHAARRRRQW